MLKTFSAIFLLVLVAQPLVVHPRSLKSSTTPESIQKHETPESVRKYLKKFGYLEDNNDNTSFSVRKYLKANDEDLKNSIKRFQEYYNLNVSGKLDSETAKLMSSPPDDTGLRLTSRFSFFKGKPQWPSSKRHLTYGFESGAEGAALELLRRVFKKAFRQWSRASTFTFSEVRERSSGWDIVIGFHKGEHGDGVPFEKRGRALENQLDVYSYTLIIDSLCKDGRLANAREVFQYLLIKGYHLDVSTYIVMINGFCRKGFFGEALAFLSKMEDAGCIPNVVTYEIIILQIMTLCYPHRENHNLDRAIALLKKIKEQRSQLDVYSYTLIIDSLCKDGRLANAREVFQYLLIKGYHLDVSTYIVMINGFCRKGFFGEALAFLSKMEDAGCIPNVVTYEIIIRALLENDENDKAEKLLREMIARRLFQEQN
uniref:Pentatricopeptide repeat-containing protein At1g09900 family n=2 Tax=Cajanus cajan TaxID=3821 RepID=A0A151R9B8_CAJCA|nr:Pentatricopeptide repeat-containing protein At1g09900 family [Cajanus cajan]